jgi:predicted nuclease of predicted toxin-antitoxin system
MKIFVDENIPLMTVQALRKLGHDVLDIRGTADEGMTDDVLWEMVQREGRLLITTDKGFVQYRDELHHGILLVRLRQPNRRKIHQRVMQAVAQFTADEWPGLLVTMRDVVQSVWRASGAG